MPQWNPTLPLRTRIYLTLRTHFLLFLFKLFTWADRTPRFPHQRELWVPCIDGSGERVKVLWYEASEREEREAEGKTASDLVQELLARPHNSPRPAPSGLPELREGEKRKRKPVHLNFHGSGFLFPSLGSNHLACTLLARQTGAIVLDCDYRKAPRWHFPAAYEDARAALEWVLRDEEGRFDVKRITVSGFSAGGALALALVGCLEGEMEGSVKGVTAFYPPTDCSVPFSKKPAPPAGPGGSIPMGDLELMRQAYLGSYPWENTRDPRLSALFCDASKFPDGGRTMILSVEYDWLDAECREFAAMLEREGRNPVVRWEKGMGHGFDVFCKEGTEESRRRDEVYALLVEVIKRAQASADAEGSAA